MHIESLEISELFDPLLSWEVNSATKGPRHHYVNGVAVANAHGPDKKHTKSDLKLKKWQQHCHVFLPCNIRKFPREIPHVGDGISDGLLNGVNNQYGVLKKNVI